MKIKRLFRADCFSFHMVIETLDGTYKRFCICPARKIQEQDLVSLPFWNPVGKNSEEAEPYMYKIYGLEKE